MQTTSLQECFLPLALLDEVQKPEKAPVQEPGRRRAERQNVPAYDWQSSGPRIGHQSLRLKALGCGKQYLIFTRSSTTHLGAFAIPTSGRCCFCDPRLSARRPGSGSAGAASGNSSHGSVDPRRPLTLEEKNKSSMAIRAAERKNMAEAEASSRREINSTNESERANVGGCPR